MAATLAVGLLVAVSDYRFAGVYRDYFARDWPQDAPPPGGAGYVAAEWGLHYYAERLGLQVWSGQAMGPNDRLLFAIEVPGEPDGLDSFSEEHARHELVYPGPFAVLNRAQNAGFYSNAWGAWPFVWSSEVRDTVVIRRGR